MSRAIRHRGLVPPNVPVTLDTKHPLAHGLRAAWTGIGSAGTTRYYDYTRRRLDGSFKSSTEPAWVSDQERGLVVSFDGTDDFIVCDDVIPGTYSALSFSLWVKLAQQDGSARMIFSTKNGSVDGIEVFKWTTNKILILFDTSAGSVAPLSNAALSANVWYHVGGTWDGSNVRLYINGEIQTDIQALGGTLTHVNVPRIGAEAAGNFFFGRVDDVRIYGRALSNVEMWQLWAPQTRYAIYRPKGRGSAYDTVAAPAAGRPTVTHLDRHALRGVMRGVSRRAI